MVRLRAACACVALLSVGLASCVLGRGATACLTWGPPEGEPARGGGQNARDRLHAAKAAFVGRFVSKQAVREGSEPSPTPSRFERREWDYRFKVIDAVKGDLGKEVVVRGYTSSYESYCYGYDRGLGHLEAGAEVALLLREREEGVWEVTWENRIDAKDLRAAAKEVPPPAGGRPAFIVGIDDGPYRTVAVDAKGRPIGYGRGDGETRGLDVCPGSRVMAEIVAGDHGEHLIATRRLDDLSLIREMDLKGSEPVSVSCRDARGDSLVVALLGEVDGPATGISALARIEGDKEVERLPVAASAVVFARHRDSAFMVTGKLRNTLTELDLSGGRKTVRGRVAVGTRSISLSPSESRVACVTDPSTRICALDLNTGAFKARRLDSYEYDALATWLDDDSLASISQNPKFGGSTVQIFDTHLALTRSLSAWRGGGFSVAYGRMFAVNYGVVYVAPVDTGLMSAYKLETPETYAIAAVEPAPVEEPSPTPSPSPAPPTREPATPTPTVIALPPVRGDMTAFGLAILAVALLAFAAVAVKVVRGDRGHR